ncbi:hypothetical protein THAOC_37032, partial [Thalassiosira oceanica]
PPRPPPDESEGQGRAVVGGRGDAHPRPPPSGRAECVRIISLLDTNNHAGPGGQRCPLVDTRPGAEARRHDRALVDAGRTELVVWGIGSSIMVDHDNCMRAISTTLRIGEFSKSNAGTMNQWKTWAATEEAERDDAAK